MTEPQDYATQPDRYYAVDHVLDSNVVRMFDGLSKKRVLNVGCGRAASVKENSSWMGIDFNPELRKVWEAIGVHERCYVFDIRSNLEAEGSFLIDSHFEATVSMDFFEHLQPVDIRPVIRNLHLIAPAGIHIIDATPVSGFKGTGGKNLHPSGGFDRADWRNYFRLPNAPAVFVSNLGRHRMVHWGLE